MPHPNDPARSLETQRRIVARLDALFVEVAEARRLHAAIEADTSQLMDAVLGEVFPDPALEMPNGWMVKTVRDLSRVPQYGYTKPATEQPVGPKFLRITDIQNGRVDWSSVPYCECDESKLENYRLYDGDIVFARSGATTGKTFLVKNPPLAVFASYLIRLRIERDAAPDFVWWFFQSPHYWSQIRPRGAAQPNINARVLEDIRVPVVQNEEKQKRIVAYLNEIWTEISSMIRSHKADRMLLNDLEQSILVQAFRGEL